MYNLIDKEAILEMFPILKSNESAILNMVSQDGIGLYPVFIAMKTLYPEMAESLKKNVMANTFESGNLLLRRVNEPFMVLTMPIQESWKTGYDIEYVTKGFQKISSVYKERGIISLAIQDGVIPRDVIDKLADTMDLPEIVYYKEEI